MDDSALVGAPRIHGEMLKLGFEIAESTVSKYMVRRRGPPSQTWQTFLRNHADASAAIDLCLVPTLTFQCLFTFLTPATVVCGDPAGDGGVAGATDLGSIPMGHRADLFGAR